MKVYGNLEKAQLEALSASPSPSLLGRVFFNSTTLLPGYDSGAAIIYLADVSSSQTLTNKTITSPLLNVDNIRLDGNTISSTDTNGVLALIPNGTGTVGIGATPSSSYALDVNHATLEKIAGRFSATTAATNTSTGIFDLRRVSSGDMSDGFGTRINFVIRDTAAVDNTIGSLIFSRSGGDDSGKFTLDVRNAGVSTTGISILPSGAVAIGSNSGSSVVALDVLNPTLETLPGRFTLQTATTGSQVSNLTLRTISSGDMTDGYGGVINWVIRDTAAVDNNIGFLGFTRSGADNSGAFRLSTRNAGSAFTALTVSPTGVFNIPQLTASLPLKTNGSKDLISAAIDLTSATEVTGALPVNRGGTGAATFTANNVLLGNGTSALQVVAPGTNGNVLTSNGTTWISSPAAGGASTFNANIVNGRTIPIWDFTVPAKLTNPATLPASTGNAAEFSPDGRFLAIAHATTPFVTIYEKDRNLYTKLSDPATLPASTGNGVAWSKDGRFLAIAHNSSPFVTIYERSGTTFTKLTNPGTLPASTGKGVSFSNDGRFLAVAHSTTPYVTIYERSGTTFTKLTNPATLPQGDGNAVSFSPDGSFLAVGVSYNPQPIVIYSRSGTTFTKLSDPATMPDNAVFGAAWSPAGDYLSLAHDGTTFLTIYSRSGSTFTKISDPATMPTGLGNGISYSKDGLFMSVSHFTTPFVTIYSVSGTTYTKITNPSTLPASTGRGVAWSAEDKFLAVAHSTTPFVTIYETASSAPTVNGESPNIISSFGEAFDY